jgi:hypothetical protein
VGFFLGWEPGLAKNPAPGLAEAAESAEATITPPQAQTAEEEPNSSAGEKIPPQPSSPDPMAAAVPTEESSAEAEGKKRPPLTPDLANLNLGQDLELQTLDTGEPVLLPAGTYRQILRIPIDSPNMQSAQKTRAERRPPVKVADLLPPSDEPEKKPFWIRYESLEKIKINGEERRGGLDIPINGPTGLGPRLWYAKSETADTASSVFYFIFGGLGYGVANLAGWSAGNTREIPGDFEYRLIRR